MDTCKNGTSNGTTGQLVLKIVYQAKGAAIDDNPRGKLFAGALVTALTLLGGFFWLLVKVERSFKYLPAKRYTIPSPKVSEPIEFLENPSIKVLLRS
jgi:hypothetical protein